MKSELKRHSWINPCSAYRSLIKFLLSKTCLLKYVATYLELVKALLYLLELEFINFTNRCFNPVFVFWYTQVGNVACKFYTLRECSLHNFPPKYFIKTLWKRSNLFCRYMFKKSKKYFVYKSTEILTLFLTCTMHWEFITFNKKNESVIKSTL